MMSQYTPLKDQFFYIRFKPREKVVHGEMFGADKVVTVRDGSYRADIFRCVATDDTNIVAQRVYGGYSSDKPYLFVREDATFNPVGPEVMKALEIEFSEQGD
jgi:hypothetical protein